MSGETASNELMEGLLRAHKWRFTLKVGDAIDVRVASSWNEGRISRVHEDSVWVQLTEDSSGQPEPTIDRFSYDLQPPHTFTRSTQESLATKSDKEASSAPVSTLEPSPASAGAKPCCAAAPPRGDGDGAARCEKRVALVGSSGGGAAAQGQSDGLSLLRLAREELKRAGVHLAAVQFVACEEPLDLASPASAATLWVYRDGAGAEGEVEQLTVAAAGTLSEVNEVAKREDAKISAALRAGGVAGGAQAAPAEAQGMTLPPLHGLVAISCDVHGVNSQTFAAARDLRAPVVGTGGSSLGTAMAIGCLLVGSSGGSVATTNKSKVVSYAAGLAGHWRLPYDSAKELMQPLGPAATFAGCLPAQIGVMVAVALGAGQAAILRRLPAWALRLLGSTRVVGAAVAARQVSALGDMATAAGILAGSMCMDDTLAALVSGTLAGFLCSKMTGYALNFGVPATALSLYATATSGILAGAIVLVSSPFLEAVSAIAVSTGPLLISLQTTWIKAVVGAGMGCLMCYGSKVGWYHRVFLPVIVLELSGGQGSIWGAMDMCALCMVAAGLCAAHLVRPDTKADVPLARRGLAFNLCFGDFVEAAYPFMERCRCCNLGAYAGSALSGAVVVAAPGGGVPSTAYLPLPLAVAACPRPAWLLAAASAAFFAAFWIGLLRSNKMKQS
eukprot:g10826.t1